MKKFFLFLLLLLSIGLIGCQSIEKEKLALDNVDVIPDIDIEDCLANIQKTNPDMSNRDANSNCLTIEAINRNDKKLCDEIKNSEM